MSADPLGTKTRLVAEIYHPEGLRIEDGYDKPAPPGWYPLGTYEDHEGEGGINWEGARKEIAKGDWRVVRETITREIATGPKEQS